MSVTTVLEAAMLICFGTAWPLAKQRMLHGRRTGLRGLLPTALVLSGDMAGLASKLLAVGAGSGLAPVFRRDRRNAFSVARNLALPWRFGRPASRPRLQGLPNGQR